MGDQLPVAAAGAVTSATADQRIDPTTGGVVVAGAVTATPPTNPTAVASHLASAALPASGVYTSQSAWTIEAGTTEILASIAYTRSAAGGYPRFRPMWTTVAGEQQGTIEDSTIDTSAAPLGRTSLYLHEVNGPTPSDGTIIHYTRSFSVRGAAPGATAFRLIAAEVGVTATPGTLSIALSGVKQ